MTIEKAILSELESGKARNMKRVAETVTIITGSPYENVVMNLRELILSGKINLTRDWKVQKA